MGWSASPPIQSKNGLSRMALWGLSIIILVAAVIYFIWPQYFDFMKERPVPVPPSSEQAPDSSGGPTPTDRGATAEGPQDKPLSPSEIWELEKIKDLMEKIRGANLAKNINLFMSCYASDFKDREEKEKATVESWASFNYLSLSYELKSYSISLDTAKVKVEWLMKFSPKAGGNPKESNTVLDVTLKKEDNDWKIKEISNAS
jgi:hypothetical protein